MIDPFYLIVDRADWISRLAPCGLRLVQLRIKDRDPAELKRDIRSAREICAKEGVQLVVNDYWRLAIEEGCDFIHLGQEDLETADLPAIRAAGCRLGVSTHDHRELDIALAAKPDYVALGPVFATTLKQLAFAPQGTARVTQWKAALGDMPLVAIGGLTPERAVAVLEAGADSAAVVTDILGHADPEARTREWVSATQPFRKR